MDDPQALARQVHVGDHLGVQQRDRVAGDGVAEAGVELLGHRRAADDVAALQHRHLQSGAGEIEGADQPVVAAADDDDVALVGHQPAAPGGCGDAASGMAARIRRANAARHGSAGESGPQV